MLRRRLTSTSCWLALRLRRELRIRSVFARDLWRLLQRRAALCRVSQPASVLRTRASQRRGVACTRATSPRHCTEVEQGNPTCQE